MSNLALAPTAVLFPVVFCLTYFLCVGPRRAIALTLVGAVPLVAVAMWLDTGGSGGTCGTSCLARQDAAPVAWYLALGWVAAVAAGTAFGAWRDHVERQVKKSRAASAQPGA
jgi:hypothetical protein